VVKLYPKFKVSISNRSRDVERGHKISKSRSRVKVVTYHFALMQPCEVLYILASITAYVNANCYCTR